MRKTPSFLIILLCLFLCGCESIPKQALAMVGITLENRQMQTRYFESDNELTILSACSSVLQDLGFNLDESETELGLIVASKDRDATDAGQVVLAIALAAFTGTAVPVDATQKIRASIVTCPSSETENRMAVRVTFQRIVWNTQGNISKLEMLNSPEMYQGFFEKLSKAVFLEEHAI